MGALALGGPYTAEAVACFAFEKDVAFVDTNVRRVLHRLFFGSEVPEPAAKEKQLLRIAEMLVPSGRGWKWGQSVIEFGALRCTARRPLCESCPLGDLCVAEPAIRTFLAGLPRGGRGAVRYEESNRYYRGRVLAVLREAPEEGIPLRELGEGLREGFSEEGLPWLYGLVGEPAKGWSGQALVRKGRSSDGRRGAGSVRRRLAKRGSAQVPVRVSLP